MTEFTHIKLKPELLRRTGLPEFSYPVPLAAWDGILTSGGQLGFEQLLYWLQEFISESEENQPEVERAMRRLTELLAPEDEREAITAEGDTWFFEIGPVDLERTVITIQRHDDLVAAFAPRNDGTLRLAAYRPLDAKSIRYVLGLAVRPHPEGGVCMRENNWEYALDQAAHTTSALYAYLAGTSYLSFWEFGVGVAAHGERDERYFGQLSLKALPPNLVATQIGVYYQLCPEDPV